MTLPHADSSDMFLKLLKSTLFHPRGRDFSMKLRDDIFGALHRNVENFGLAQNTSHEFFLIRGGFEIARVSGVVAQSFASLVRDAYTWMDAEEEKRLAEQFAMLFTQGIIEGMDAATAAEGEMRADGWKPGDHLR